MRRLIAILLCLCGPALAQTPVLPALNVAGAFSAGSLSVTGGAVLLGNATVSGTTTLSGPPTSTNQAATKGYVDTNLGSYLPLTGGTVSGTLTLSGAVSVPSISSGTSAAGADGVPLLQNLQGMISIGKQSTASENGLPNLFVYNQNYNPTYQGLYVGIPTAIIEGDIFSQSNQTSTNLTANLNVYGGQPYSNQNTDVNAQVSKYGQGSTWMWNGQTVDYTGIAPGGFAQWSEWDYVANGPDTAATLYNGQSPTRLGLGLFLRAPTWQTWTASHTYAPVASGPTAPILIQATNTGSVLSVYRLVNTPATGTGAISTTTLTISGSPTGTWAVGQLVTGANVAPNTYITALGTGTGGAGTYTVSVSQTATSAAVWGTVQATASCTSGSSTPTWPTVGTVADGGCYWGFGEVQAMTAGTGISIDGGTNANWNTGLWMGNTAYANAVIDMSAVPSSGTGAGLRLPANMNIDFTGNGTAAGQNLRTLAYSTYLGVDALQYEVPTYGVVFAGFDDGHFQANGPLVVGVGTAGNLTGITAGYSNTGLTVGRNAGGAGEINMITGTGAAGRGLSLLSTDGSGNITPSTPYFAASSGLLLFNGHLVSQQAVNPTVAQSGGTGSSTLNSTASDFKGTVTEGTSATGFVVTFNTAYSTAPDCVVSSPTGTAITSYTPATGTLTLVNGTATGAKFTYHCIQ